MRIINLCKSFMLAIFSVSLAASVAFGGQKQFKVAVFPDFDHPLLEKIEKDHPKGFGSAARAFESLRGYAVAGEAEWCVAVYRDRGQRWRVLGMAKVERGGTTVELDKMLALARTFETKFSHIRTIASISGPRKSQQIQSFAEAEKAGLPALIFLPTFHDLANQLVPLVLWDYDFDRKIIERMRTHCLVTPAGIFEYKVLRKGTMYEKFQLRSKSLAEVRETLDLVRTADTIMTEVRESLDLVRTADTIMPDLASEIERYRKEFSQPYSVQAIADFAKGDKDLFQKEFNAKKELLKRYQRMLAENGIEQKFIPFEDQRRFWLDPQSAKVK